MKAIFDGTRKGKRGRGVGDKTVVFGILKHKDRVCTIIKDTKHANAHHQKQSQTNFHQRMQVWI